MEPGKPLLILKSGQKVGKGRNPSSEASEKVSE